MSPMSWFFGEYVYNLTNNEIEDNVHILLALISQRLFMYCGFNSHGFVYQLSSAVDGFQVINVLKC